MRKSFLITILACQFLLSFLWLVFVELSSIGYVENTYFWFIVPAIIVSYIITISLSIKEKNVQVGIISSILFFACLKLVFSLKWTDDIIEFAYSNLYRRSVGSVQYFGYLNFEGITKIFVGFAEHPSTIITLSMVELVTGLKFELIFSYLLVLIQPLIIMPIIYRFLRRFIGLDRNEAILGVLLYNSNFLNFGYEGFGYGSYGFLLFVLSLYFLGKKDKASMAIFFILCFVNSVTYSISSYALIFFVTALYIVQRLNLSNKIVRLSFTDVLFPIITTSVWTMYRATSDIATVKNILEFFLGHLTLVPEITHPTISQAITDPYAHLIYFTYVGQGLFLLLGFCGLIAILFSFRNRKNIMYILLWLVTGIVLAFFAFGVSWLSLPAIIGDYRFRFVKSFWLLLIPLTVFGFQRLKSTFSRILNKHISFMIIGIVTFLILFSPIANNASQILRREPISPSEPIAAPHQWIQLSKFVSSYARNDTIFLGCESITFLWTMGVIPENKLLFDRNPYFTIIGSKGPYFIALTSYNLYLPSSTWSDEPILTERQFESINLRSNKYLDSGDVWLYYYEPRK